MQRLKAIHLTANGTTLYNYDVIGNLRGVTLEDGDYVIDARNRRIAKKVNGIVTQKFLYLNQLEPIAELDSNDNIVSLFIYGTRSNTPEYIIKNNIKYKVITNQLGSVVIVVNVSSGEIVQSIEYDSFGNILSDSNPNFQPFTLAGGIYDNDTQLTRFGARDYDAREGRWTSKDPIKFDGGRNFYVYAVNNPVNYVDLDGRDVARGTDLFLYQLEKNSTIIDNYAMKLMEYYACKGIEEDREFFGYQDGLSLNNDLLNVKFGDIGSKDMSVNRKKEANSKFYIHGHGKARWLLDGEFFSNNDINAAALNQINGYLITPSGRLLKWELSTGETSEIGKFDITQCNCPKDFPYNIILGEK